ncbi:MAG: hypothetical protein WBC30_10965 [Candidatus Sulfotelmatobacter sp.]
MKSALLENSGQLPDYQCEHCGQPLGLEHNCNGVPFVPASPQKSIPATGSRKDILRQKGFHETSDVLGDVYYDHPIHGRVCIYPGGVFRTVFTKTTLSLDKYLKSLDDSSYAVIEDAATYTARCRICDATGNPFPLEGSRFPHEPSCPYGKRE